MSGCTGHCCKAFSLPWTPEETQARASKPPEEGPESHKIANMIIYKGFMPLAETEGDMKPRHVYTCKHLQADGSCGDYANRPMMCCAYPYGKKCIYKGCTFSHAERETKWYQHVQDADLHGCTASHIADSDQWSDYRQMCGKLEDGVEQKEAQKP